MIEWESGGSTSWVWCVAAAGEIPDKKPIPVNPIGPNVRTSLQPFLQKGVFDPRSFAETNVSPNFGPDKVHSWNIGFERELTKNSAFEARYAGNRSLNLFQTVDANPFIADLKTDFPNLVPAGLTPCPAASASVVAAIGRADCSQGIVRQRNNDGYSNYHALQLEYRANNLFKQLTVRTGFTWSKTLDNVSEIFSTFGGGNTSFASQNPSKPDGRGEYSFSGLDIPRNWSISFNEQFPFFREQHGVVGHLLGGWGMSATYILSSGERYTPVQAFSAFATTCSGTPSTCGPTSGGDYYDLGWIGGFVGIDTAHPFLGSLKAPSTAVGMYALDGCNLFGVACASPANQLVSLTAFQTIGNCLNPATPAAPCNTVNVTKDQVRFILNAGEAQSIFGTPFGNVPRNPVADSITHIAHFSITKRFKMNERASFEFRTTMLNALNHNVFTSVDPFMEDAGLTLQGTGFGNNSLTQSFLQTGANGNRTVIFGGTFRF